MDTNPGSPVHSDGGDYNTRLTRIEGILEVMANQQMTLVDDHRRLLTAQVVLTDRMDQLVVRRDQLAEAQIHTDERLNALITIADGLIRPKEGGQ